MTSVNSSGQSIIDKFAAFQLGQYDEAQIIESLKAHLAALGLRDRPVVVYQSPGRITRDLGVMASDLKWTTAWLATANAGWNESLEEEWKTPYNAAWTSNWYFAWSKAWNISMDPLTLTDFPRHSDTILLKGSLIWCVAMTMLYKSLESRYGKEVKEPCTPVTQALAAGMFSFGVTKDQVVAIVNPKISFNEVGQIHAINEPAIEWGDEKHYYVDGVKVSRQKTCSTGLKSHNQA